MLYPPNTIQWRRGDHVLHWCDEKSPKMLMRVIGFTRDGLVKTQYTRRDCHKRTIYTNQMTSLLNPMDFNINPEIGNWEQSHQIRAQQEWFRVRVWNMKEYKRGQLVRVTSADGPDFARLRFGQAEFTGGGEARIWLDCGLWGLRFVEVVSE